jgi:hypothetical protein
MDRDRWQRIETLLEEIVRLPAAQRASFLRTSCKGDHALEQEIWSLLAARQRSEGFLEEPAIALAARAMNTHSSGGTIPAEFATGETVSHYRIVEKIGSGGMKSVSNAFSTRSLFFCWIVCSILIVRLKGICKSGFADTLARVSSSGRLGQKPFHFLVEISCDRKRIRIAVRSEEAGHPVV